MEKIAQIFTSYLFVMLIALLAGVLFTSILAPLAPYAAVFLGGIFFLSTLAIKEIHLAEYWSERKVLLITIISMLILFPVLVYYITYLFYPQFALPFLLLAAMPSGMTAPFLTQLAGGQQKLALALTVLTSLLAPISIPLLVQSLVGHEVAVPVFDMLLSLFLIIFTPFVLSRLTNRYIPKFSRWVKPYSKRISTVLLGLLVAGIAAEHAGDIVTTLSLETLLIILLALFLLFGFFHLFGYFSVFWTDHEHKVTVSVCLTYMNFTLAIYIAGTFFDDLPVMLPIILAIIPWVLLITPFRWLANRSQGGGKQ